MPIKWFNILITRETDNKWTEGYVDDDILYKNTK